MAAAFGDALKPYMAVFSGGWTSTNSRCSSCSMGVNRCVPGWSDPAAGLFQRPHPIPRKQGRCVGQFLPWLHPPWFFNRVLGFPSHSLRERYGSVLPRSSAMEDIYICLHIYIDMGVPPSHHPFFWDFPWRKPSSYWEIYALCSTRFWGILFSNNPKKTIALKIQSYISH